MLLCLAGCFWVGAARAVAQVSFGENALGGVLRREAGEASAVEIAVKSGGHPRRVRSSSRAKRSICVIMHTTLDQEEYRNRTLTTVATWARDAEAVPNVVVYYLVDPKDKAYLDPVVPSTQMLSWHASRKGECPSEMVHKLVRALNMVVGTKSCDWLVVPEDDCYVNMPVVAEKLARVDLSQDPTLMGAIYQPPLPFVHGHFYVMNPTAVPLLLRVADTCQLDCSGRSTIAGPGDIALAECINSTKGVLLPAAITLKQFGCFIKDDEVSAGTMRKAERAPEPECIDAFHKVLPDDMRRLHQLLSKKTCSWSTSRLMKQCGPSAIQPYEASSLLGVA